MDWLITDIDERGVASLCLNRPEKFNAFDEVLIGQLVQALSELASDPKVRLLVLKAEGKHFSAGADLNWMQRQVTQSFDQNLAEAEALAELMMRLDSFPHPTVCRVQGSAFGGALGLIACCDIAVAEPKAQFCLSEVKLGLIPAVISPYMVRTLGHRQTRRYALTAERFDAATALALGLVHEVTDNLDSQLEHFVNLLLGNGPEALVACKQLLDQVSREPLDDALRHHTANEIARIRVSPEGQEGLKAFFDKRPPGWQVKRHV
ncbi:enoyl-CoA hydratase-related protein [Gallaecimonas xiamenensis]|uniref:Enoyl-CoA hydratase/isomerase n=1 Tax=Gallaecimonas xiamenensis 3-C-1 TaxID=745411 RepID=K2ILJ1_9GAMM|nr:enoyl-CoA hydratase-related protein [Gallaecimonas xiamenensis]EKE71016.1 enoyl-CoA hydratase/isomerase [Gallaecimonas xiamenensis 3-C-1]